ncbi:MAG: pyridoxamine 5'-phosphate oxidase family protein [Streptosporangiaceae bacterium]
MYEDQADIESLQQLLSTSLGTASEHLRSIIGPGRTASAADLASRLTGMRTLALSTVSAAGRPRISGVDGHFLRARWVFTTSGTSVKAADMRSRPAVSAAYLEGDTYGVFTHGDAEFLAAEHPDRGWIEDHLTSHYGASPSTWGPDIVYLRIRPRWMVGYDSAGGAT